MITEYFTPEEISSSISKIYLDLIDKIEPESKRLKRDFLKRRDSLRYPFVYAKIQTITFNGNTYVAVHGSTDRNSDNFAFNLYLVLNTSIGKRYYRLLVDGTPHMITKHFIDRFIERSEYPVTKDNFLLYFSKDMISSSPSIMGSQGKRFMLTESGLVVHSKNELITYVNKDDLSSYKDEIKDGLEDYSDQLSQSDRMLIYKHNLRKILLKGKS